MTAFGLENIQRLYSLTFQLKCLTFRMDGGQTAYIFELIRIWNSFDLYLILWQFDFHSFVWLSILVSMNFSICAPFYFHFCMFQMHLSITTNTYFFFYIPSIFSFCAVCRKFLTIETIVVFLNSLHDNYDRMFGQSRQQAVWCHQLTELCFILD